MDLTLAEVAGWCDGIVQPETAAELHIHGVTSDSRTAGPGDLFVAINGLSMDGHRFVRSAAQAGAVAALVEKQPADSDGLPVIRVSNSLDALGRIANRYRWRPPLIPWIGVTGSNGKTTTRELLALVLSRRWVVKTSRRNWNNQIGLPLSMLSGPPDAGVAVMEMGTNHPGEIAVLREICVPTIGIVTSTGDSHLEGFGSSQTVAREKADIFGWLPPDGLAVYPADDPNVEVLRAAIPHASASFSTTGLEADMVAEDITVTPDGTAFTVDGIRIRLPLLGRHNVGNCLAAMLAARHLGIGVAEAATMIAQAKPVAGRLQVCQTPAGLTVVNDAYNANPDSVMAGLEVLTGMTGNRKIAVLGDMMELGPNSRRLHREIGMAAGMMDLDALFATGPESAALSEAAQANARIHVKHFPSVEALWMALRTFVRSGDTILVKGSRGMLMERIVNQLMEWFPR